VIEVLLVRLHDSVQMAFAEDQEVIEALSTQAAEEALTEGIGPRCSIWRFQWLDS